MAKKNIKLKKIGEHDEYFQLEPDKKTVHGFLRHAATFLLVKPFRLVQFGLGRLISYALLNPLLRKIDQENAELTQNQKYPDPALSDDDDIVIISIVPEPDFVKRGFRNWFNRIKNSIFNSPFVPIEPPDPKPSLIKKDTRVHELIGQVGSLINGITLPGQLKEARKYRPDQIHFKGLHHLSPEHRAALFQNLKSTHHYDFEENFQKYKFFTLRIKSGAELDSVEVRPKDIASQPIQDRKFIIPCLPRSNNYTDWLKQHRYYADQLGATIVAFNYQGTGQGKGIISSQKGMRLDAKAQVQRLIAMGAKPENIALMGECLGGNIATHVAAELHKEGCPVKLFSSRSMRSTASIILEKILPPKHANPWNPLNWLRWVGAGLAMLIVVPLLYLAQWDLNVEKAFKSIPVKDRDFLVVRSKKDQEGHRYHDDTMVPHKYASIYSLVKSEQKRLQAKQDAGEQLNAEEQAWLADKRNAHKFHVDIDKREDAAKANGHTCQLRYLSKTSSTEDKDDGRDYTLGFFRKAWGVKGSEQCGVAPQVEQTARVA